ncbi:FMN-binding protein [Alkaliphilus hydrothermalis]|uniref:Uncharacterized protein with FMN-binding domain n=1 Tax=Alkaliphilus hydrothermalis TaxID=1482730 RepID=A0ABS2NPY9_9FIRM|nr:FMN-binding protein [Alkaliphilus hydrothermalis]MBM7615014.1 uncharacterized protein with FMN-binding domain [Alkaliphilus hydrothermalis]
MDKQQKIAIILLPILTIALLAGATYWTNLNAPKPPTYVDGTYEGVGEGYYDDIKLAVTIADGNINSIEVVSQDETPDLGDVAIHKTIDAVIAAQSTEVDSISGATFSSQGTINAINAALEAAVNDIVFPDGNHEGFAEGYAGEIKVKVVVAKGAIRSIDILEIKDTPGLGDDAAQQVAQSIIDQQTLSVDTVSGATVSSEGLIAAVKNALGIEETEEVVADPAPVAPPAEPMEFVDGEYTGSDEEGFYGKIDVTVIIENKAIKSITVNTDNPDEGISASNLDEIIEKYLVQQTTLTEGVDAVSGVTYTTDSLIRAVNQALSQAQ